MWYTIYRVKGEEQKKTLTNKILKLQRCNRKEIIMSMEWSYKELEEICRRAGLEEEWHNADGETFEDVVYKALDILGIDY